jgi:hypothetical protein
MMTFLHAACSPNEDRANILLLNHERTAAIEIATPAATKVNKSYLSGIQKSVLFAKNSATKLSRNKTHFIGTPAFRRPPCSRPWR